MLARLSSGSRIHGARDDPAGQAISDRMSASLRGMSQAARNISDGSSMLQVAEGAMASVTDSLQRLRELAVASGNGSYTDKDRAALQKEAAQILQQINSIGKQTEFNGSAVFSQDRTSIGGDERKRVVLDGLKTGWLSSAEDMIKQYYGLSADGARIRVNLDGGDGGAGVLASVSGTVSGDGKFGNLHLNLDMSDFGTAATPDGGGAPFYSDRIVAHEMAHAIMGRAMNYFGLPKWFREGTAELIHGADERVRGALAGNSAQDIVDVIAGGDFSYEGGYVASRYMHDKLKDLGVEGGIKGVMQYLDRNQSADLGVALNAVTGGAIADTDAFLADFDANGAAFITGKMDLWNADTGAIGGLDADGGAVRDARAVVPGSGTSNASDGLANFDVVYPDLGGATGVNRKQIQVGDNAGDLIELQFSSMNAQALGLADFDLDRAAVSLLHVDQALAFVNEQRVNVGAASNRLDLAASGLQTNTVNLAAAKERIEGVDYASAAASLTRSQILQRAASAMLAQANTMPRAVLSLLR
jgi:flagellin